MEMIYRKIEDLRKSERNPRCISEEQFIKLKESIERNPDYFEARPIILSDRAGELVIIAGNQRYEACVQLGIKKVPTVLIPDLNEEREHEIMIRDNVSNGEWDISKLLDFDCDKLFEWGLDNISFPETNDMAGVMDDTDNILRNENYEAGAHINYLVFEGYKIPISETELSGLKQRANEYLEENGVMIGFVNKILGL